MPTAEYDKNYLEAGLAAIEAYLQSSEVFWPIGIQAPRGENVYPQLSLGGLLLARERLRVRLATGGEAGLQKALQELAGARSRWPVAWERKATAEFPIRLNLWRDFLEDYRQSPVGQTGRYAYEIGRRVQLHLLLPETRNLPAAYVELLSSLDGYHASVFVPGDFAWEAALTPGFPQDPYWYLYGSLKKK
jgi:hypothetical protein